MTNKPLKGRVALVAGATRGAGRGIARMLGEAGATVWCSGRSTTGNLSSIGRPETIDETAELVNQAGGTGIAAQTDHSDVQQVSALIERIRQESGRLDILVNDIGGESLNQWKPFAETELSDGLALLEAASTTHLITSHCAAPFLIEQKGGLILDITDGDHGGYRGNVFYDLAKNQSIRMAFALGADLRQHGIAVVAVTPGFLRSEMMLEMFGVTSESWQEVTEMGFSESETPCFVGRAVAALAADPEVMRFSGQVIASWTLAREYGFTDIDGRRPDWGQFVETSVTEIIERPSQAEVSKEELSWVNAHYMQLRTDSRWADLMGRVREWRRARQP